jgi:cytochrome d ubiquinol oxidase subunit I
VPITIGLALLIAILESIYVHTGDEDYRPHIQFWGRLFLINFAVGVVTGLLQEFRFGMVWANYSRFVGDIFGALLAFFMESTFIGVWNFGWDRISKKLHLTAIWLVAFATMVSGFWILTANSFMQKPVGYQMVNGHAQMNNFGVLLTNPQLWVEFPHTILAAYLSASFFMLAISAFQLLRHHHVESFKRSFKLGAIVGLVAAVLVIFVGDLQASHLVKSQPMKLAAAEALWNTSSVHAPWNVISIVNTKAQKDSLEIKIPDMLTLLAYKRLSGSVEGIHQVQAQYVQKYGPGNYIPPVAPTYYAFRTMIFAGTLMLLFAAYAVYLLKRSKFAEKRWFLITLEWSLILPYLANSAGWIMTEVGRQPWVVYGLLRTASGVSSPSSVSETDIILSLTIFAAVYGFMAVSAIYLFRKYTIIGMDPQDDSAPADSGPTPMMFLGS